MPFSQPVHRGIELMHIDLAELQFFRQRMLGGFLLERGVGAQFRAWRENARDNEGHHQVSFTAVTRSDQIFQPQVPGRLEDRQHIAMRQTPDNFKRRMRRVFIQLTSQPSLDEINDVGGVGS